jgi:hypothetical protein
MILRIVAKRRPRRRSRRRRRPPAALPRQGATLAIVEEARGVEVYTSRHKAEVAAYWRELAESKHKYWTSSSDDHRNARFIEPACGTPARTLERICRQPMKLSTILAA